MDTGIWVNEGLQYKLNALTLLGPPPPAIYVLLGTNSPFTPLPGWTVADIFQPGWGGYVAQPVAGWLTPTVDTMTNIVTITGLNVVFTNTSGSPVTPLGYALATGPTVFDTLLVAGAFAHPPTIPDGGAYVFTPFLSDKST